MREEERRSRVAGSGRVEGGVPCAPAPSAPQRTAGAARRAAGAAVRGSTPPHASTHTFFSSVHVCATRVCACACAPCARSRSALPRGRSSPCAAPAWRQPRGCAGGTRERVSRAACACACACACAHARDVTPRALVGRKVEEGVLVHRVHDVLAARRTHTRKALSAHPSLLANRDASSAGEATLPRRRDEGAHQEPLRVRLKHAPRLRSALLRRPHSRVCARTHGASAAETPAACVCMLPRALPLCAARAPVMPALLRPSSSLRTFCSISPSSPPPAPAGRGSGGGGAAPPFPVTRKHMSALPHVQRVCGARVREASTSVVRVRTRRGGRRACWRGAVPRRRLALDLRPLVRRGHHRTAGARARGRRLTRSWARVARRSSAGVTSEGKGGHVRGGR
jgi:hypothetical protein